MPSIQVDPSEQKINAFLASEQGFKYAGTKRLANWRALKAIDCAVLKHYWSKVDSQALDLTGCSFQDFNNIPIAVTKVLNRQKQIVIERFANYGAGIVTKCVKGSSDHGLCIIVESHQIIASISKNGNAIFKLAFTSDGKEVSRVDVESRFQDIIPNLFLK